MEKNYYCFTQYVSTEFCKDKFSIIKMKTRSEKQIFES